MSGWTMVEPCAGSAAVTCHLLGAKRAILPFQGSKWRLRRAITGLIRAYGFLGAPREAILTDVSAWGFVLPKILGPDLTLVIDYLKELSQQDAECVYLALNGHEVAPAPILRCAEFLFLQRLAFSGKAVGIRDGKWKSAGFNRSSAYGTEKTNRFGEVKPMIPSMISALEDYLMLERATILGGQADADTWTMSKIPDKRTFVLFDPPYRDTTRYPDGDLPRERVVELALKWRAAGATVCVCEAEPLMELVDHGFQVVRIDKGKGGDRPFHSQKPEWLCHAGG